MAVLASAPMHSFFKLISNAVTAVNEGCRNRLNSATVISALDQKYHY
jgi:hypothetical protein